MCRNYVFNLVSEPCTTNRALANKQQQKFLSRRNNNPCMTAGIFLSWRRIKCLYRYNFEKNDRTTIIPDSFQSSAFADTVVHFFLKFFYTL